MEPLRVLLCLCLAATPAPAEVGSFGECRRFFYGGQEPRGLGTATKICQRHGGEPRFATLYDGEHLGPRWSAYTLSPEPCPGQAERRGRWFVEPQLSGAALSPEMSLESECAACGTGEHPAQALSAHYEDTAFVRGQLNPGGHQCGAGRVATFTLTNAVPLEPCFAQGPWRALQRALGDQLRHSCTPGAYVVTGATPGTQSIPGDDDEEGDRRRPPGRVAVPRHLWTAACCQRAAPEPGFSVAFLAENAADAKVQALSVAKLEEKLAALHGTGAVSIFAAGCHEQGAGAQEVIAAAQEALEPSRLVHEEEEADEPDLDVPLSFPSVAAWHERFSELYRHGLLTCVLQPPARAALTQCVLRQQKHLLGSTVAAEGWPCDGLPCRYRSAPASPRGCYTAERGGDGGSRVPCCSGPCSAEDGPARYTCDGGAGRRVPCSPQYSAATAGGRRCREGFECGLYGEDYFWCYVDGAGAWDYCCAPHHPCSGHGYGYAWCYVDRGGRRWRKCVP